MYNLFFFILIFEKSRFIGHVEEQIKLELPNKNFSILKNISESGPASLHFKFCLLYKEVISPRFCHIISSTSTCSFCKIFHISFPEFVVEVNFKHISQKFQHENTVSKTLMIKTSTKSKHYFQKLILLSLVYLIIIYMNNLYNCIFIY